MKFAYIGTVKFSYEILKHIIILGYSPEVVITQPDKGINSDYVDLSPLCEQNRIPIIKEKDINSVYVIEKLKSLNLDYIFCFGWSRIIKKEVLEIPKHGIIGYHPAKLPQNRGRHPLIWALVLGLKETASTFFFVDEGIDSGDILSQKTIKIEYKDDANSLYEKMIFAAKSQIEEFMHHLVNFNYKRIPQDQTKANYWRKRTKNDGKIDFRMSSRAIYNLVRALTKPYVGAHLYYKGEEIKIWKVAEVYCKDLHNMEPGKIISVDIVNRHILVKAYYNCINIIDHEFKELPKEGEYLE